MPQAVRKRISARKLTILLLLAARDAHGTERAPITGTTRMQKLVFLAMEGSKDFLREDETFEFDFNFSPDKFGPADLDMYQDLELLKATECIRIDNQTGISRAAPASILDEHETQGPPLLPEEQEEAEVSFEYLMGEHSEEIDLAEAEREFEREYAITDKGMDRLDQIAIQSGKSDKFKRLDRLCQETKRKYAGWPLNVLLRHVYTTYPETTVRSQIAGRF
ncbi:MAG: hypothetical protein Q8P22_09965 [Chloroflexota bacterium]|nr:hypothetical protein [Chloroflexota bacterium]